MKGWPLTFYSRPLPLTLEENQPLPANWQWWLRTSVSGSAAIRVLQRATRDQRRSLEGTSEYCFRFRSGLAGNREGGDAGVMSAGEKHWRRMSGFLQGWQSKPLSTEALPWRSLHSWCCCCSYCCLLQPTSCHSWVLSLYLLCLSLLQGYPLEAVLLLLVSLLLSVWGVGMEPYCEGMHKGHAYPCYQGHMPCTVTPAMHI